MAKSRCRQLTSTVTSSTLPVSLDDIAVQCGIRDIVFRPLLTEGGILRTNDGFILYIDADRDSAESYERQMKDPRNGGQTLPARIRFTISHEIAHTFFYDATQSGMPKPLLKIQHYKQVESLERVCNAAAADILMPKHLFRAEVRGEDLLDIVTLETLARKRFGVSIEALVRRIRDLKCVSTAQGMIAILSTAEPGLVIKCMTGDGRVLALFPRAETDADARSIIGDITLGLSGGAVESFPVDIRCFRGHTKCLQRVELSALRLLRDPESYVLTVRTLGEPEEVLAWE